MLFKKNLIECQQGRDPCKNFIIEEVNSCSLGMSINNGINDWQVHKNSDALLILIKGELVVEFGNNHVIHLQPFDYLKIPSNTIYRNRTSTNERTVNLLYECVNISTTFLENSNGSFATENLMSGNLNLFNTAKVNDSNSFILEEINNELMLLELNDCSKPWTVCQKSDKLLMCIEGELKIEFKNHHPVILKPFEILKIPNSEIHRTFTGYGAIVITFMNIG